MANPRTLLERRARRTRSAIRKRAGERPRLSVFRSGKHIYALIFDDRQGSTVAAASSLDKDLRSKMKSGASVEAAGQVGKLVAERAVADGIGLEAEGLRELEGERGRGAAAFAFGKVAVA